MSFEDELTRTVLHAAQNLSAMQKAEFLLQTALSIIEAGGYGEEVERYLEVFLATPGIHPDQVSKALFARGNARRVAADKLLSGARQDFRAVAKIDPSNHDALQFSQRGATPPFASRLAYRNLPLEVLERVASYIPRYHLRSWLFASAFHRSIARRLIFQTIDVYFGDDADKDNGMNRGLDIFDRVKSDPCFARLVRRLRVHWSYEEGDLLDLVKRIFRDTLPAFKALKDFEWIGYPEMGEDMVQTILASHPHLRSIGLVGWHFDALGISGLCNLRQFTLRAEDDDGYADMDEIRTILDHNHETLVHLTLGAYLVREHSWDDAFRSATIQKLTHLDLVDTRISHFVFKRIAHAQNLRSLTLHGMLEQPESAAIIFGSDHVIDGQHKLLPHLTSFRFIMVGHDDEMELFRSVVSFLRGRTKLRRLDLGDCPWDLVKKLLPGLTGLRALRVKLSKFSDQIALNLVGLLSPDLTAMHVSVAVSDQPMNTYAHYFSRFHSLSMLHLASSSVRRPQSSTDHDTRAYDLWAAQIKSIPTILPSLDFVGWHREHYVVVRSFDNLEKCNVEVKELPARRRLDCGNGVDLGTPDAHWIERKDVPIDYERSGLEW